MLPDVNLIDLPPQVQFVGKVIMVNQNKMWHFS